MFIKNKLLYNERERAIFFRFVSQLERMFSIFAQIDVCPVFVFYSVCVCCLCVCVCVYVCIFLFVCKICKQWTIDLCSSRFLRSTIMRSLHFRSYIKISCSLFLCTDSSHSNILNVAHLHNYTTCFWMRLWLGRSCKYLRMQCNRSKRCITLAILVVFVYALNDNLWLS